MEKASPRQIADEIRSGKRAIAGFTAYETQIILNQLLEAGFDASLSPDGKMSCNNPFALAGFVQKFIDQKLAIIAANHDLRIKFLHIMNCDNCKKKINEKYNQSFRPKYKYLTAESDILESLN